MENNQGPNNKAIAYHLKTNFLDGISIGYK